MSAREQHVLGCLAQGLSDKQVARALGISDQTARTHRRNMLDKTATANVCALLHLAFTQGWLPWPCRDHGVQERTD
ncbi:helix-turn-helix domain-containing protein [Pseudomonas sp. GD03860]|uniref:response regulator transcription factor n=1 Tax=Pseudomonas TaxID=286 RepID=UPI0023649C29|nr:MULTISPECIES: helix-turn-helix domain-containing protein [Pseudomonas]MDD2058765.1 helix-turn-helix domain-containing protein [Pseudomonas putida]MDH0636998.1 helix-turn-helix domain-containing protein [Pseudomonas sp. GD03860]